MVLSFVDLRDVEGHFDDLGLVILFSFLEEFGIGGDDEVDGNTLSTESTRSTDSVDVGLLLEGQVVVDNEIDLVNVDTSGEEISGDQDSGCTSSEFLHD